MGPVLIPAMDTNLVHLGRSNGWFLALLFPLVIGLMASSDTTTSSRVAALIVSVILRLEAPTSGGMGPPLPGSASVGR